MRPEPDRASKVFGKDVAAIDEVAFYILVGFVINK